MDTVQDFHKAASSFCHKCHCLCVCWGCVCVCDSVMFVYHFSTMAQKASAILFASLLCPRSPSSPNFLSDQMQIPKLFWEGFSLFFGKWHKGNHTLTAARLFIQSAPFIEQEPGWGRHCDLSGQWAEHHLFSIQCVQLKTKQQFDFQPHNVNMLTYLSCRSPVGCKGIKSSWTLK